MARAPFKLKSGNKSSFKNLGSSPMHQEKHFLERKPTIPMEKHKGGDPNYKPELKSKPKLKPLGQNKKRDMGVPQIPEKKKTNTNITKGDVLQTVLIPQVDLKKTIKVGEHYTKKAIKKGKELLKKDPIIKYLNKGSGTIPKIYGKVKKYLKSDA
tara:strand:- start:10 stop:474 length:465 start_codon:yes stop_codon:yes gene_type:complete